MIDQITVRPASPDDAEALSAIWLETAEILSAGDARFKPASDGVASWCAAFLYDLNQPDRAFFTAVRRGKAVGYLSVGVRPNPGYAIPQFGVVYELCIDSHGRGGGTGSRLWEAAIAWFQERNVARIEINTPTQHAIAQAFWRAIGARAWYDRMWIKL